MTALDVGQKGSVMASDKLSSDGNRADHQNRPSEKIRAKVPGATTANADIEKNLNGRDKDISPRPSDEVKKDPS